MGRQAAAAARSSQGIWLLSCLPAKLTLPAAASATEARRSCQLWRARLFSRRAVYCKFSLLHRSLDPSGARPACRKVNTRVALIRHKLNKMFYKIFINVCCFIILHGIQDNVTRYVCNVYLDV